MNPVTRSQNDEKESERKNGAGHYSFSVISSFFEDKARRMDWFGGLIVSCTATRKDDRGEEMSKAEVPCRVVCLLYYVQRIATKRENARPPSRVLYKANSTIKGWLTNKKGRPPTESPRPIGRVVIWNRNKNDASGEKSNEHRVALAFFIPHPLRTFQMQLGTDRHAG